MSPFSEKVYTLLSTVPAGRVTTYKALAEALDSKAYQAIGQIMRNNPYAPEVPCHRVVKSDGTIGGFRGSETDPAVKIKMRLLIQEGVSLEGNQIKDFENKLYTFASP